MADLARMYDVADARPLREQLVRLYAQRTEPEATDKLLDIARVMRAGRGRATYCELHANAYSSDPINCVTLNRLLSTPCWLA